MLAGGNPDEYLEITNQPTVGSGNAVQGFQLDSSVGYAPGVSGAIAAIEWSLDLRNQAFGHAAGLAIVQGATETAAGTFVTAPLGFGGWVNTGPTLLMPSNLSGLLDISASGAPFTLGIFSATATTPTPATWTTRSTTTTSWSRSTRCPSPARSDSSRWLSPSRRCSALPGASPLPRRADS